MDVKKILLKYYIKLIAYFFIDITSIFPTLKEIGSIWKKTIVNKRCLNKNGNTLSRTDVEKFILYLYNHLYIIISF